MAPRMSTPMLGHALHPSCPFDLLLPHPQGQEALLLPLFRLEPLFRFLSCFPEGGGTHFPSELLGSKFSAPFQKPPDATYMRSPPRGHFLCRVPEQLRTLITLEDRTRCQGTADDLKLMRFSFVALERPTFNAHFLLEPLLKTARASCKELSGESVIHRSK